MTPDEARERGFSVDQSGWPWVAYKGPRFAPVESFPVDTPAFSSKDGIEETNGRTAEEYMNEALLPGLKKMLPKDTLIVGTHVTPYDVVVVIAVPHKFGASK